MHMCMYNTPLYRANRQTDRQQKHQKTATAGVGRDGESAEYMETEVVYLEE